MTDRASWAGRPVAVTGAGGFIGSHLVEELAGMGAEVRALVHYNSRSDWGQLERLPPGTLELVEVVSGDVTDAFAMRRFVEGRQVVFHLAALIGIPFSYVAPQSYLQVNIQGTLNVLEACRAEGVRLIHTSTSEVYGTARYAPIDEQHPLQGQSPYSASKIAADKLAESYHRSFQLPVVTVRPFNTYGPRQSARALVPTVITQALGGATVRLGSQEPVRDLTFVTDTVRGFIALADCTEALGRTVNLSSGRSQSVGDIARTILRVMGSNADITADAERVRPAESEVLKLEGDATLAREIAGWAPEVPIEEGIERTASYIRENLFRYKPSIYNV